jgi:hypothetical protein
MKDPFANLDESLKHALDGVSVIATVGSLIQMLPSIAAVFTIVWTGIRIYETDTVQKLFGRKGGSDAVDK